MISCLKNQFRNNSTSVNLSIANVKAQTVLSQSMTRLKLRLRTFQSIKTINKSRTKNQLRERRKIRLRSLMMRRQLKSLQ